LHGRSLPYGERTGYGAFAEQVKGLAGIFDSDPVPGVRAKLVAACGVLPADDARQVASHLAVLLGLDTEEIIPDKAALLFSARRFVEAVAGETPTIFAFEDVHWSDPSLLDLIESLASRSRHSPTLLFTLARPELLDARPTWGGGLSRYTALALDPLPAAAAQALAAQLAPHVSDVVTARLGEVAGGNPLFIEELAASVSDTTAELLSDLPTNVKATIAARLDGLPPGERQTILDASVVGKIFCRGALERQGAGGDVADLLDSLERRDFIRREPSSRFQGDAEFSFKHMLIREVAYATLPKAARRERHATVARFLEDAAGDRLTESASLLAHHWLEAGDAIRARDYLVQAAERARRAWASGEAVRLYDEALRLVDATDAPQRRRLRLARAFALFDTGELTGVAAEIDGLLPELVGRDRAEGLFLRAQTAFWTSESADLGRLGEELAELASDVGDGEYERLADLALAEHRMLSGALDESIALGERALRSWPADERPAERATMLGTVGLVSYWTGAFARSVEANDAGWRLGEKVDSVTSFLYTGPQLGLALAGLGRHEEAVAHMERVLAQARELELVPRLTSRCLGMFSGVLYELHQTERARRLSEEAIDCGMRAGFTNARIMAKMDLLQADMADGELGRADAAWPALWEEAGDLKGWHEWLARGRLRVARADLLLALGDAEEAARAADAALAHWRSFRRPKYEAAAHAVLGQAELALGRPSEGVRRLETAVEIAERLGHPPTFWRTAGQLAAALRAAGEEDRAAAIRRQVAVAVEGFAAGLSEGLRGPFLAAAPVRAVLTPSG
ncbi:MAG: tetratricopeptide repeat protein, partial [Actinobacteria bacterium]|nr:tetratricopeptide repeat protein [Actinomycetota bacterium]